MTDIITAIENGIYDSELGRLYTDTEAARSRYAKAAREFGETFDALPECFFSAPGRTEICGNHLDHQHGCVIAAAVDIDIIAAVAPRNDGLIRIRSGNYTVFKVSLRDLSPREHERGRSAALVRGVAAGLAQDGVILRGFDAYMTSDIPPGSGVSSSAAFEVLVGNIMASLAENAGQVDPVRIAQIGQFAENEYFGKPSGLMDQMACSVGSILYIDFKDPSAPEYEKIDTDLAELGLSLCLVNSGGSHADLTDDYADILNDMTEAASAFGGRVLRDVDRKTLIAVADELRGKLTGRELDRARHFFDEMDRVEECRSALKNKDTDQFLRCISGSGDSSERLLKNIYSPSHPEERQLEQALIHSKAVIGAWTDSRQSGATRVHGGGFAGTLQAFVPTELAKDYREHMEETTGSSSVMVLNIRHAGGVKVF